MKMNNKGFSLVEVVVVVAVSSIVFLMITGLLVNSTRMYHRETGIINLQSENQLIVANLTEAFMEATKLEINQSSDDFVRVDLGNASDTSRKADCRRIFFNKDSKFLGMIVNNDTYLGATDAYLKAGTVNGAGRIEDLVGYQLSRCVETFTVTVDESCHVGRSAEDIAWPGVDDLHPTEIYTNPIKLNINYTLKNANSMDVLTFSVTLRNNLKWFTTYDGTDLVYNKVIH